MFRAMCGVTLISRNSITMSTASKPLSPPSVIACGQSARGSPSQGVTDEALLSFHASPLAQSMASESLVEAWVSLSPPFLGLKLFMLAQASTKVPSTEKSSEDSSFFDFRQRQDRVQELHRYLTFEQPIVVDREHRIVPHRIIDL